MFGLCIRYSSFVVRDLTRGTELMRTADEVEAQSVELKLVLEIHYRVGQS